MPRLAARAGVVRLVGVSAAVLCCGTVAQARPMRGPVARAERRVIRAQMALERELGRPLGFVRVNEVPAQPLGQAVNQPINQAAPPVAGGAIPRPAQPGAVPAVAPMAERPQPAVRPLDAGAAAAIPPGGQPAVARAAFEAGLPRRSAPAAEQAADGTVSVLVRPDREPPAAAQVPQERAEEPLLFPGASSQP